MLPKNSLETNAQARNSLRIKHIHQGGFDITNLYHFLVAFHAVSCRIPEVNQHKPLAHWMWYRWQRTSSSLLLPAHRGEKSYDWAINPTGQVRTFFSVKNKLVAPDLIQICWSYTNPFLEFTLYAKSEYFLVIILWSCLPWKYRSGFGCALPTHSDNKVWFLLFWSRLNVNSQTIQRVKCWSE